MTNYPLVPPQNELVVGFAHWWWHLRQALAGNGVLIDSNDPNGMKVTRTSATEVAIAAGHYANKGIWKAYAGGSVTTIPAASAGYHRYDAICMTLSTDTIARVAGSEAIPDTAANFMENFTPLPPDLNSTDYIVLAIICVDENGIRSGDNGTYSTAGICDTRPPCAFGIDNDTLQISADGKLEAQGGVGSIDGPYAFDHADASPKTLFEIPAGSLMKMTHVKSTETDGGGVAWTIGTAADPDLLVTDDEMPSTSGDISTVLAVPKGSSEVYFAAATNIILTILDAGSAGSGEVSFEYITIT